MSLFLPASPAVTRPPPPPLRLRVAGLCLHFLSLARSNTLPRVSHSAYGEGVFLILQTALIAALVLFFSGRTALTLLFTLVYPALLYYLVAGLAPMDVLWALQSANVPIIVAAKVGAIDAESLTENPMSGVRP